ncbi:MAG: Archaeal Lon protease [archaeon ADurb.Bin336]|nr:MAG: Archaeal Lon protease [archaeon ADurb.Bin336]
MESNHLSKVFFVFISLLFILCPAYAILDHGSINIFAVTEDNKGMAAELRIQTIPGTGKSAFITSNSLVGKDTQTTGNIAIQIAQKETNVLLVDKDLIFDIRANASEVDGPSAGAAMALLTYSMFSEKPLQSGIGLTGTINSDGSIGMVGGVGAKAVAASKIGIKLFMIPLGEAVTDIIDGKNFETVNLLEYGPKELGMKVVEVNNIKQVIEYAYSDFDSIVVDSNTSSTIFIPSSINYEPSLIPMKRVSDNYITDAESVIESAKKALDSSGLEERILADFYNKYVESRRYVEMSKRFLDQNYLYSSANSAFHSRLLAGTIKEIAQNPSMLLNDTVLLMKVNSLKQELNELKLRVNYIPANEFEWIIGAQQRMAYAENALNEITSSAIVPSDTPLSEDEKKLIQQNIQFGKVYDYVSAQAWISVAKDFLVQADKDSLKYKMYYSNDFKKLVNNKMSELETILNDSNSSDAIHEDSLRRYHSALISRDNNYFFAALFDLFFAESFVMSEANRKNLSYEKMFNLVESDINSGSNFDSVWANMYFDHSKFYYENAVFSKNLGQMMEYNASVETSYDLLYLSKNLASAKEIVLEYIAFNEFEEYVVEETFVDVKYNRIIDPSKLILIAGLLIIILILIMVLIIGLVTNTSKRDLGYSSRRDKLKLVLSNLDKALSKKKISDAEYFFMKRRYEEELEKGTDSKKSKGTKVKLSLEDLKAKERALKSALVDIKRHYKEGLIIPEDYERSYKQLSNELDVIKFDLKQIQIELRETRREKSVFTKFFSNLKKEKKEIIKGTEELAEEQAKEEEKEKIKRKKILRRFAYKNKTDKKNKEESVSHPKLGFD